MIEKEIIANVVNNVVHMMIAILGVYAAMYVVNMIVEFAAGAFEKIKIIKRFKVFSNMDV